MPKPATDINGRLPDLTSEEVAAVVQWARRAKAGDPHLLRACPQDGELVADPMGETQRPDQTPAN